MNKVSGSKMSLLRQCPAAFVLPWSDRDPDEDTTARDYGTAAHKYFETGKDPLGEFAHIPRFEHLDMLREVQLWVRPVSGLWCVGEPEDFEFGMILSEDIVIAPDGRPELPEFAIGMRADAVAMEQSGVLLLVDLKTGSSTVKPDCDQMLFGAYILTQIPALFKGEIHGAIVQVPRRTKKVTIRRMRYHIPALHDVFNDICLMMKRACELDQLYVVPAEDTYTGRECTFCPALDKCPGDVNKYFGLRKSIRAKMATSAAADRLKAGL